MKNIFIAVFVLSLLSLTSVFGQRQIMEGVNVSWGDIHKTHSESREFIAEEGESVFLINEFYTYKGNMGIIATGPKKYLYSIEKYDKKG